MTVKICWIFLLSCLFVEISCSSKKQRDVANIIQAMEIEFHLMKSKISDQERKISWQEHELSTLKQTTKQQEEELKELKLQRKRSDDLGPLEAVVSQLSQKLTTLEADVQTVKNVNTAQDSAIQGIGAVYVRWGNAACPSSSELVYSGYMGGSYFNHPGGAANYLCLLPDPVFDSHPVPRYGASELYGTEYETCDEPQCDMSAVCAVCRVSRPSTVIIPGSNVCRPGWTLEYSGYLMADHNVQPKSSEYVCVDSDRGYLPGTMGSQNGALLYYVTATCGSLSCPPYQSDKVILCAVCSK